MPAASLTALEGITLADGRYLSFSAIGPADGSSVLYMHGAVGSPLRRVPELDGAIASLGVRYVMLDRPGYRASDPMPGRTVADVAADVEQLADRLRLERFGIVGVSAGAPYALACAARMPDRVSAAVVSALSPWTPLHRGRGTQLRYRVPLRAMVQAPRAIAWFGDRFAALMRRRPGLGVRAMEIGACEADRRLLAEPMGREALAESFLGAMRGGCAPMIEDYLVCCRDWGFDPAEARGTVSIWHGLRDKLVPVEAARALASRLPDARLNIDPDEGHFFYKRRIEDILAGIIDRAGGATCASRPRPQESPQQALRAQAR